MMDVSRKEISVGLKIHPKAGPQPYGTGEVNELIKEGWHVVEVRSAAPIFEQISDGDTSVRLKFTGVDLLIVLEFAKSNGEL